MRKMICLAVLLLVGCHDYVRGPISGRRYYAGFIGTHGKDWAYWQEVRQDYINQHPELEERIKNAILFSHLTLDMTKEQFAVAMCHRVQD